jgi:hypothetical protein
LSLARASSFWREQESSGILRNPQESSGIWSKYRNSCPPQEFLQKIPVKSEKNRNYCDPLQNHVPVKNSSGKRRKKILRNPVRNAFLGPKNKFLKTGITNLAEGKAKELPASAPEIPANPPTGTEGCKHHHL